MAKPMLPKTHSSKQSCSDEHFAPSKRTKKRTTNRRSNKNSDVLVSAVVSSYLLTHLHHVLQRAEYGAIREGREAQAANFAQLRKVLCMDARSMKDASAMGQQEMELEKIYESNIEPKVA